jgi:hypothetical protein
LKRREGIEATEKLLKILKLESRDMDNIEWEGKKSIKEEELDSDVKGDTNPLAVLASTNSVLSRTKIIKYETPAKSLITEQDLKEAKETECKPLIKFDNSSALIQLDPVLEHVCDNKSLEVHEHSTENRTNSAATSSGIKQSIIIKYETPEKPSTAEQDLKESKEVECKPLIKLDDSPALIQLDPVLEHVCDNEKLEAERRFLPFRNAKVHERPAKNRDNSAASPPIIRQSTIMLSLRESIEIENKNREVFKALSEKQAAERLVEKMKAMNAAGIQISTTQPMKLSQSMSKYRLPAEEHDVDEDSDDSFESALSDECENA